MPCIWLGHFGEYYLRPLRLGANTTFPRRPAASGDQDGIDPQSLRTQMVFLNMSSPDAWYSSNTCCREAPPGDAYWVIHVTGRNLRILTVNTNNWVWGFNLHNNNVNAMHLAWTYWGIPSLSFEIGGQYHLPPSACGLRWSGWYWPPISQDSDGIPHCYSVN